MNETLVPRMLVPILCGLATLNSLTPVNAEELLANFDSLSEGSVGLTFVDGGITFLDGRRNASIQHGFTVDDASSETDLPGFSPPNVLSMSGVSPGGNAGHPCLYSFRMTAGQDADACSMDVFVFGTAETGGNQINLELLYRGVVVGQTSATIHSEREVQKYVLSTSGTVFDEARYFVSGSGNDPVACAIWDNIRINTINVPPIADAGSNQLVECTSPIGALVQLDASGSSDPDDDDLTFTWSAPAGITLDDPSSVNPSGTFPIGVTTVVLVVADTSGAIDDDEITITVRDTEPPVVDCSTNVSSLWPPSHDTVLVNIYIMATDTCSAPEDLNLVEATVASNEADSGNGSGDIPGDVDFQDGHTSPVAIANSFTFNPASARFEGSAVLRAERNASNNGRIYTISVQVADQHNNSTNSNCVVVVPHDRRPNN